jgi:hypothetical protein
LDILCILFESEPNQELIGQATADRGTSGAAGNNKQMRGGVNSQLGNIANPPHDPRTGGGQVIPATSESRNIRYNGGGGPAGLANTVSNTGAVKWGQVPPHDNRQTNARGGGHGSTKDKMR